MSKKRELPKKECSKLHINLSDKAKDELTHLKVITEKQSISDVIHAAVSWYKFLVEEQQKGTKIILRDRKGNYREVIKFD